MSLVDTHCHVHFNAYKNDMDDVVRRSLEKGVRMVTVGTQSTTSANGLALAERFEGVYATIGLHPNHLCEQEFFDEQELEFKASLEASSQDGAKAPVKIKTRCETFDHDYYLGLSKHPKCVAIGECGLDYYRLPDFTASSETSGEDAAKATGNYHNEIIAKQKETVRAHFDLASEANLPVVIHCRDAHADQLEIIREYVAAGKLARRGVVHCFTGTIEEANAYVALGFLISFTGVITFPPRKSEFPLLSKEEGGVVLSPLQTVVRDLPLEYMMVETDAPYLTPVPHRGERNEPWMVQFVAEKIAALKGVLVEEVARVTTANAERLFALK